MLADHFAMALSTCPLAKSALPAALSSLAVAMELLAVEVGAEDDAGTAGGESSVCNMLTLKAGEVNGRRVEKRRIQASTGDQRFAVQSRSACDDEDAMLWLQLSSGCRQ